MAKSRHLERRFTVAVFFFILAVLSFPPSPARAITRLDSLELSEDDGTFNKMNSIAVDSAGTFAYIATSTSVIKLDLQTFKRVGSATMLPDESRGFRCIAIDNANDVLYTTSYANTKGRVAKIRLSDLTRVSSLDTDVGRFSTCAIDLAASVGYFATYGAVKRVSLSSLSVTASLPLENIDGTPVAATIDTGDDSLWLVGQNLLQISLASFTRQRSTLLGANPANAAFDLARRYVYVAAETALHKVRLSDGQTEATRAFGGANPGFAYAVNLSPAGDALYVGCYNAAKILSVRLSDLATVGEVAPHLEMDGFIGGAVSRADGKGYFVTNLTPPRVVRIAPSPLSEEAQLLLKLPAKRFQWSLIDRARDTGYFLTRYDAVNRIPILILKVRLSDLALLNTRLLAQNDNFYAATADFDAGYLYLGDMGSDPAQVAKIRLDTLAEDSRLTLAAGERGIVAASVDSSHGYGYFATLQGRVVKVRLSDFTRVGATAPLGQAQALVLDTSAQTGFLGALTNPASLQKFRLDTLAASGSVPVTSGAQLYSLALDAKDHVIYVGTGRTIERVDGASLTLLSNISAGLPGGVVQSGAISEPDRIGYFVARNATNVPSIIAVSLNEAKVVDALALPGESENGAWGINDTTAEGFLGTTSLNASIVKLGLIPHGRRLIAPSNLRTVDLP